MFQTSIAGSLPKPGRLSETEEPWPQWRLQGSELQQAKADATLLWNKAQEVAGLDIVVGVIDVVIKKLQALAAGAALACERYCATGHGR